MNFIKSILYFTSKSSRKQIADDIAKICLNCEEGNIGRQGVQNGQFLVHKPKLKGDNPGSHLFDDQEYFVGSDISTSFFYKRPYDRELGTLFTPRVSTSTVELIFDTPIKGSRDFTSNFYKNFDCYIEPSQWFLIKKQMQHECIVRALKSIEKSTTELATDTLFNGLYQGGKIAIGAGIIGLAAKCTPDAQGASVDKNWEGEGCTYEHVTYRVSTPPDEYNNHPWVAATSCKSTLSDILIAQDGKYRLEAKTHFYEGWYVYDMGSPWYGLLPRLVPGSNSCSYSPDDNCDNANLAPISDWRDITVPRDENGFPLQISTSWSAGSVVPMPFPNPGDPSNGYILDAAFKTLGAIFYGLFFAESLFVDCAINALGSSPANQVY